MLCSDRCGYQASCRLSKVMLGPVVAMPPACALLCAQIAMIYGLAPHVSGSQSRLHPCTNNECQSCEAVIAAVLIGGSCFGNARVAFLGTWCFSLGSMGFGCKIAWASKARASLGSQHRVSIFFA